MPTQPTRVRVVGTTAAAPAQAELRRRILAIVDCKFALTDMEIWRASAPDYLPWNQLLKEIWALDQEQKLRLEVVRPGHWIIHSLKAPPPPEPPPSKKASAKKPTKKAKKVRATKAPQRSTTKQRIKRSAKPAK